MIDLEYNYNKPEPNIHQKVAEALVLAFHNSGLEAAVIDAPNAQEFCLQSPMLRLIKERNEARELVHRLLLATECAGNQEYYAAMLEAHRAILGWKEGK